MQRSCAALALLLMGLAAVPPTEEDEAAKSRAIGAILSAVTQPGAPGLAAVVRKDGRVLFEQGYGIRKLGSQEKIDAQTNFRLASLTKEFTAMAIMLLVKEGKVRYDERLTEIFPEFPAYGREVTVRNLLNHTGGLPDYEELMDREEKTRGPRWSADRQIEDHEVLALLEQQTQGKFPPGTSWAYSNSGYVMLGLIVAKISRVSYRDFLRKRIFDPAGEFHKRLGLTGVVLTKLDGDARGGAALSIAKVSGAPVKFVGLGEKYDALEGFYPERIVSRVLGMGDILSLIERAESAFDKKAAIELERKLRKEEFTLEDFRDQLKQIRKMGPLDQLVDMLPKVGPLQNLPKDTTVDEKKLKQVEAIINSMTNEERRDHNVIDGKRRKRIAKGSGTSVQEVNQVIKQYLQMRTMMKQYGALAARSKMKGLGKLAGLG